VETEDNNTPNKRLNQKKLNETGANGIRANVLLTRIKWKKMQLVNSLRLNWLRKGQVKSSVFWDITPSS
jgi:hypothetical protein